MRKPSPTDPRWSDVTPQTLFLNRRALMLGAGALAMAGPVAAATPSRFSLDEPPTDKTAVTTYTTSTSSALARTIRPGCRAR